MNVPRSQPVIHRHANGQALARDIATRLAQAVATQGHALLRVSGGRSAAALFEHLREQALDWAHIAVQLVDERLLPEGHAERNDTLLQRHLLQGRAAQARVLPLDSEHAALVADVTVLGMGEDGHTASLFPGAPGIDAALQPQGTPDVARLVPAHAPHTRLSLNLAALLRSRHIVLSIAGAGKWTVCSRALAQADATLPISLVFHHAPHSVAIWHAD